LVILVFGLKIGVDLAVNRGLWFVVAGLEKKDEKLKKKRQKVQKEGVKRGETEKN